MSDERATPAAEEEPTLADELEPEAREDRDDGGEPLLEGPKIALTPPPA